MLKHKLKVVVNAIVCMINRLGVARAVLQTPLLLIHSLSDSSFSSKSSRHLHFQTIWARDPQFWENVHLSPSVTFHLSCVTCHESHVTCHIFHLIFFWGGGTNWWSLFLEGLLSTGPTPSSFLHNMPSSWASWPFPEPSFEPISWPVLATSVDSR